MIAVVRGIKFCRSNNTCLTKIKGYSKTIVDILNERASTKD